MTAKEIVAKHLKIKPVEITPRTVIPADKVAPILEQLNLVFGLTLPVEPEPTATTFLNLHGLYSYALMAQAVGRRLSGQ